MAPKKGKGGKKAKEKALAEERERLAEEARLAEIAEQERKEKERIENERLEKLRKAEEERLQAELDERLLKEDEENSPLYADQKKQLVVQRDARLGSEEWDRYIDCNPLPEVSSEAEVNGFLTEWNEAPALGLSETVTECELGHRLVAELLGEAAAATERNDEKSANWQLEVRVRVDECLMAKLDTASADFLSRAEEYANAKNEVLCCVKEDRCKLGLWVNLAKNPRVKSIDFAELNVSTELPKALALASIAIRAMQFRADRLSPLKPPPAAYESPGPFYMTIGGVLVLELLTLPPPAKKVKGWTMRMITELSTNVHRQPYPIPPTGADATASLSVAGSAPPLRISYEVPETVVVPEDGLMIGWFDEQDQLWRTEGISDHTFDKETRVVSFSSVRLSTGLALIQPSHIELPFKRWLFTHEGRAEGVLYLETQQRTYEFAITAEGAALRSPRLPELEAAGLLDVKMSPPKLLFLLRGCGINLCPADLDAKHLPKITPKEAQLERELHAAIAPLVPHLELTNSKWNASRGAEKCLFRLAPKKPQLNLSELTGEVSAAPRDPFKDIEDSWQTMVYANRYVSLIKANDAEAVCDMSVCEGVEAHSTPVLCLREQYPDVGQDGHIAKMRIYQDYVRQLFNQLRPFSFTGPSEEQKSSKAY